VYCADNPVKYVDLDGREIDYETYLAPEQSQIYSNYIAETRKNSPLFNNMYSALEVSSNAYSIRIDETPSVDGNGFVDGFFNEANLSITYSDESAMISNNVSIEELFHAFQYENNSLYSSESFNTEFEAKVAKFLIVSQMDVLSSPQFPEMSEYLDYISDKYNYEPPSGAQIKSNEFYQQYKRYANEYSNYNIYNNYGNSHYKSKTEQTPKSLFQLYINK
jgi:hypothetical protein